MMKEDKPQSSPRKTAIIGKVFTHPGVYVLLILIIILSYSLGGYFSKYPAPPPQFPKLLSTQQLDNFRDTTQCGEKVSPDSVFQTVLDRVFDGESPFTDFPPAHASSLLKPKRIMGCGSNDPVFKKLIERVKPRLIVEIGTFLGASAIHMASVARELGLDETRIICVDDFRGWPEFRDIFKDIGMINGDVLLLYQFMQNVVYSNATGLILPLPFSSVPGLEKLCEWGVVADLIEIDAGHDFISVWGDINKAYRILRPGGVLFGHDYFYAFDNRGVSRAVNLFAQMNNFKITTDVDHWVIYTS